MDEPPVWLLDIDGVLNAISAKADRCVWPADDWVRAEATCAGVDWPLLAAGPVLDFVREVHRAGRAEIRWHTTWQEEAAGAARALRLPDLPVQPCPEFAGYSEQGVGGAAPTGHRWWKLPAADRVAGEGRAMVWTDDDIEPQLRRYGEEHPILRRPDVLAISPRTVIGLTPRHLRMIDEFLAEAAAAVAPRRPPVVGGWHPARRPGSAR